MNAFGGGPDAAIFGAPDQSGLISGLLLAFAEPVFVACGDA